MRGSTELHLHRPKRFTATLQPHRVREDNLVVVLFFLGFRSEKMTVCRYPYHLSSTYIFLQGRT